MTPRGIPLETLRRPIPALAGLLAAALCLTAAGCGGAGGGDPAGGSGGKAGTEPAVMALHDGPVDAARAAQGEELFKAKGCSACHAFGKRVTGPDLAGVTTRRTREWLVRMVMHPDEMLKSDPTARELLATYAVPMPNLKLSDAEAQALVEYMKAQEAPTGTTAEGGQ